MKYLPHLSLQTYYYAEIERIIADLFSEMFYKPIIAIFEANDYIMNSKKSPVIKALESGRIKFYQGKFYGKMSSSITKELKSYGAVFDKRTKMFKIAELPPNISMTIGELKSKQEKIKAQILETINYMDVDYITDHAPINTAYQKTLERINSDFLRSVKQIGLPPDITPEMREIFAREYVNNMKLYIKKFSQQNIKDLRQIVETHALAGGRSTNLIDAIKANYNTTRAKAKSLARQETSLVLSKFSETRYKMAGIKKYKWSTSHDIRVRHDHKELDGKIITWDNPPIVDRKTGARAHAGEWYNCLPADANINLAYGIKKCFRRWYVGVLTEVVLASGKTIRATPNHQVLTLGGWKAIGSLNSTDYLINLSDDLVKLPKTNINSSIPSISEIFDTLNIISKFDTYHSKTTDFHGDGVEGDVNVINTTSLLRLNDKAFICQNLNHFTFANSNSFAFRISYFLHYIRGFSRNLFSPNFIRLFSYFFSNFFRRILKTDNVCFRTISNFYTSFIKSASYNNSFKPRSFGNRKLTFSRIISIYDRLCVKLQSITRFSAEPSIGINAQLSNFSRKIVSIEANNLGDFIKAFSLVKQLDGVVNVSSKDFAGHVYNLETVNNWYLTEGIIIHNCRCVKIPIVE